MGIVYVLWTEKCGKKNRSDFLSATSFLVTEKKGKDFDAESNGGQVNLVDDDNDDS